MALSLQNLQHVEVKNCILMEYVIVIAEETMQEHQTIFPSLQSATLQNLTKLLSFCSTSGTLECPILERIEVVDCPNMELFGSTFSEERHTSITAQEKGESARIEDPDSTAAFLGNKMIISGLEELKVEWKTLKDELVGYHESGLVSRLNCIGLAGFQGEAHAFLPPTFLHQFHKLKKLVLSDASFEEINLDDLSILKDKDPESLAQITKLKLSKLPNLKFLVRHDCQVATLFQNLVDLQVIECSSLKILVPPSMSFHSLTDLQVSKCDGLINLISASTARSLVQLRRMKVKDCKMMQEIVAIASDDEEFEIRFSHLEYLEIDGLPWITCFGSGNYSFHFPSLQRVKISGCPNMKNFTEQVSVSPKLRKIQTGRYWYEWEWEGNLNDTIQALYMEKEAEASQAMSQEQIE